ncbi:MAG: capsular biosynthesis protein [Pseudomonadota bacterium]
MTDNTPTIELEQPPERARRTRRLKSVGYALREKRDVMNAVILRDVRTRFFNHGLGFLVVPLWPFCHLMAMLAIYGLVGRAVPFGDDLNLFFATGLLPTLIYMYVSRFMAISLLANKPMLSFPVVHLLDIVLARAALEVIGGFLAILMIVGVLVLMGSNPMPNDPGQAVMCLFVVVAFAVGTGIIVSVFVMMQEFAFMGYMLVQIFVYLGSGTLFVTAYLPRQVSEILAWNPVLHAVEWMRTSFYVGYPDQVMDKGYLIGWTLGSIFVGLLLERIMRARLLGA